MTRRPLKVLHVIHAWGVGGAETWLMELLRHWSVTGACRMDVLITSGQRAVLDDHAANCGARLHYIRYGRSVLPRFRRAFRSVLAEGRYDAIHDHSDYASGWHFLLGAGMLPPIRVAHVHNPWIHIAVNYAVDPLRRFASMAGKRLVLRLATHVCGTSVEVLRHYGFSPNGSAVPAVSAAYCGIDVRKFNAPREIDRRSVLQEFGWDSSSKLILFAGRLDRALTFDDPQNHKNSWFALNVVRAAARADDTVRLVMAGDGESRFVLERHIRDWRMTDRLKLVGLREDVPRLMRAADVLLFPSRQEGLGMVAVEAQAAGLPVLASSAVPAEAVVIPGLYDALGLDESIDAWAGALLRRIQKPRPSMDFCGQALEASPFSIANSARRLEEIYGGTRPCQVSHVQ